ncbi:transcription initiation factor TFIID subunit 4b isoform X1 [Typha angustifolia]|uniref:transcription initiation factor TFIID subunit 4b isoform X1 n=1 Tax=Typha angustifolia TaxID=59011 RepID=UPI003C2E6CBF
MDPSIMKLLEDDEDESLHSGADVEAFTAALNRDIGGDAASISQPFDADAGVLSQGSSSASKQALGQWQASSKEGNNDQQSQQKEQQDMLSMEQRLSQAQLIQQGNCQSDQFQQGNNQSEYDQLQLQQEQSQSHQQQQTERNSEFVDKEKSTISEQSPLGSKQEISPSSEGQQQHMQQLSGQEAAAANQASNAVKRMKAAPTIPFHMLIPILRPHLDKDRSMQLQAIFTKLRSNEVSKEDFLRVIRNIVGDQMLRQAAHKVQMQLQAQAARNAQAIPNQYPTQASSQQLSSSGSRQFTEPQMFPQPESSTQIQKGLSQKPQELESMSDGKGLHAAQNYPVGSNVVNPEREISMISTQAVNKQQQHPPLPQPSLSMYGTGNFHAHMYPKTVGPSTTALKPHGQDSHTRQIPDTQGVVSTPVGAVQPLNAMNVRKYEMQNASNDTKRLHGGSLPSQSALQQNPVAWQLPGSKEQKTSAFPLTAHVKPEVVDQPAEASHKSQFMGREGSSFGSLHLKQMNSTPGSMKDETLEKQSSRMGSTSASMTVASHNSSPLATQGESSMQIHTQISSTMPTPLAGSTMKTPQKKPSVGQKKPFEALGTSPPVSSNKKQKTSGAFPDQSIEQLNDVTAVSGVNLREEEEQLLSAPKEESRASEATRRVVQEEEERLILQKGPLQKKLAEIMSKCHLKGISSDVERCLSMCVEERLHGLISHLIRLSKQRVDIEKSGHRIVVTSDIRRQILMINGKAKEEWDKKQAEEAGKLRKQNEAEGNGGGDSDKDKDEGRSKNVKVNKEEDDKMRTTAANVAARAAVGGDDMLSKWQLMAEQARQKREGLDGASSSQSGKATNRKPLPSFGRSSREHHEAEKKGHSAAHGFGGMRRSGRSTMAMPHLKVARSISVKDVITVLEREPQMAKSPLIYRLYERLPGDPAAE